MSVRTLAVFATACLALSAVFSSRPSRREAPLLLLLTVDTLRADHLGAWGDDSGATPNLDRLAEGGVVFEQAYGPASTTLPCLAALMSSRYPQELAVAENRDAVVSDQPLLAGWLQSRGFVTGAVVSNGVLRPQAGLARGFRRYDARMGSRESGRPMPERLGPDTTAAALALLDQLAARREGPVFLWVHYQDPHGPYAPPPGWRERFLARERARPDGGRALPLSGNQYGDGAIPRYQVVEGQREVAFYRAGYRGEVAWVDDAIGALLRGLDARGLLGGATIVFTADHGESLGEEDDWFEHGTRVGEPLVHVPLLIKAPGLPPERRRDLASLLDVFPTIAARVAAGASLPAGSRGRDLLAEHAERAAPVLYLSTLGVGSVRREGLVAHGYQYLAAAGGQHESLFLLGAPADLREQEPGRVELMRRELEAARGALTAVPARRQELGPVDEEALRALGYTSGD